VKKIENELKIFENIIKCISVQFGKNCEVVLHDFSQGYEESIKLIENSHVTGRSIGSSITSLGLEFFQSDEAVKLEGEGMYNYITNTKDGKTLRSSTALLRNDDGKVIGSLCINMDITEYLMAENILKNITMSNQNREVKEVFVKDVSELMDIYLQECLEVVGKPIAMMDREDKIKAIKYLDEKGVFLITKSGNRVCDLFGISKFTLYNYLDEVRK